MFENDLFQLIQYEPATEQVAARPLLIVRPCIKVLYSGPPADQFVRPVCGRARPDGVYGVLAQSGRFLRALWMG